MAVTIDGSNTPTAGGVIYGDGTEYASTAAGTSGQVLLSNGSSAPTWGTAGTSTTATNLAGGSAGTVPYQSAAGTTAMLAAGTSGQVLTSSGAGAPSWTTPSSGAWAVLSSGTISSVTTVDFETGFTDATYSAIVIQLYNVYSNGSGNASFRFKQSGSYQTTSYYSQIVEASLSSISTNRNANAAQMVFSGAQVLNTNPYNAMLIMNNRFSTVAAGPVLSTLSQVGSGVADISIANGANYSTTAAVTGVRFLLSGGGGSTTIVSGSYVTYGIKAS